MFENTPVLAVTGFFTIALGLVLLLLGIMQAKLKKFNNHKIIMLITVLVQASFLVQYITRAFILKQETHFEGSEFIKNYIYLPILTVHIITAVISIYFILRHVLESLKNEEKGPQFKKEYRERHRSYGQKVFVLWLISFLGGITIFLMLYVF